MIYEHWACCKLECNEPQELLSQIIQQKLNKDKVKGISYTEIAQRAIYLDKKELAMNLLENEPTITKRIPILLGMAETVKSDQNVRIIFQ